MNPIRGLAVLGTGVALVVLLGSSACTEPNWLGTGLPATGNKADESNAAADCEPESGDGGGAKAGASLALTDSHEVVPRDTSSRGLAACCDGKAHCVPDDKLSSSSKEALDKCPTGGFCVPDELIAGQAPKSCVAGELGPGLCLSKCIAKIRSYEGTISQETCAAGELCAPCKYPGGEPTGACEIGKPSGAASAGDAGSAVTPKKCKDVPPSPKSVDGGPDSGDSAPAPPKKGDCCKEQGRCVPAAAVPEAQRSNLEKHECAESKLCAPLENIPKDFRPKMCTGTAKLGKYTGVCLSNCLLFDSTAKMASEQGSCDSDHRCIPCKVDFGFFEKPTGAPGCE